jgi:hypothetical protein
VRCIAILLSLLVAGCLKIGEDVAFSSVSIENWVVIEYSDASGVTFVGFNLRQLDNSKLEYDSVVVISPSYPLNIYENKISYFNGFSVEYTDDMFVIDINDIGIVVKKVNEGFIWRILEVKTSITISEICTFEGSGFGELNGFDYDESCIQ